MGAGVHYGLPALFLFTNFTQQIVFEAAGDLSFYLYQNYIYAIF